jgi:rhamnosyltransferase
MINLGFRVYVFDNSPFCTQHNWITQNSQKIWYLTAGKNVGIGYSLSTLCATAYAHGYKNLLFLDQDTGVSCQTLKFIQEFIEAVPTTVQQQYAALVFSGQVAVNHCIKDVPLAISSGSLFNLSVLKIIGWHNEKYFVDGVDYEFCIRARRNGFNIGLIGNTPDFDHVTEQPDRVIKIIGKNILVRRYAVSRITDALSAYFKLIFGGLFKNRFSDTIVLIRSAVIYVGNQLIARLIKPKE